MKSLKKKFNMRTSLKNISIAALKTTTVTRWLLLSSLLLTAVIFVPRWQANQIILVKNTDRERIDWFEAENKARTTIVQIVGGIFVFMTAFAALKNAKAAEETRRLTEQKNVSERIAQAVKMLSDAENEDSLDLRLGAIYTLQRVTNDSPYDHWPVAELLCAYVRRRSAVKITAQGMHINRTSEDVKAALRVIGSKQAPECDWVNLTAVSLCSVSLVEAKLSNAHLENTNLCYSNLSAVNLTGAKLSCSNLYGALLENAIFTKAHLIAADLRMAQFKNIDLKEAMIAFANFRGAKDLTVEQIQAAKDWEKAIYDPDFAERLELTREDQNQKAQAWDRWFAKSVGADIPDSTENLKIVKQIFEEFSL